MKSQLNKNIYSFKYPDSVNVGDEIQTLAAIHALKLLGLSISGYLDRDHPTLGNIECILIINGWFSISQETFPLDENITPVFSNIHISSTSLTQNKLLTKEAIAYLKNNSPIGCRDRNTEKILNSLGIDTYFNYCLTLTFNRRKKEYAVSADTIFIVDLDTFVPLPKELKNQKIEYAKHILPAKLSHDIKMNIAEGFLEMYRTRAKLVVTSRLHCALPCIAMGIPVVVLGDQNDKRLQLVEEFIPIHPYFSLDMRGEISQMDKPLWKRFLLLTYGLFKFIFYRVRYFFYYRNIAWPTTAINVEATKERILTNMKEALERL
ncbi:MAG: polysaccharide pyruvyl transferase family protein [Gammaproteobacteria bacterium]|nr:polysaccharide pyruvyl transferase family protein [Gammaproteobacteria bacterium]